MILHPPMNPFGTYGKTSVRQGHIRNPIVLWIISGFPQIVHVPNPKIFPTYSTLYPPPAKITCSDAAQCGCRGGFSKPARRKREERWPPKEQLTDKLSPGANPVYREQTQFPRPFPLRQTKHSIALHRTLKAVENWLCLGLFQPEIGFRLAPGAPFTRSRAATARRQTYNTNALHYNLKSFQAASSAEGPSPSFEKSL
jgi:hypothetical protein